MKTITRLFTALGLAVALLAGPAHAAGGAQKNAEDYDFSFEGPFGTFDRAQLQRGWKVFKEVCHSCHSLKYLRFRNLAEPGGPEFTEAQAKAFAAEYEIVDGPNDEGEMFTRPGRLSDAIPDPYPNEQAARAANNNALPPDLSLIIKAREGWYYPWYISPILKLIKGNGGPEYVRSLIMGYEDPPHGEEKEGLNYNPYFPGHWIAMPPPLAGEDVEYADGTKPTLEQEATDVAAFLAWVAMPKMEERKRIGLMALIYMGVFALLMLMVKKALWSRVEH
jgi:ubiquinol-cytochrome c reductase cytochrome b/c1 subunit